MVSILQYVILLLKDNITLAHDQLMYAVHVELIKQHALICINWDVSVLHTSKVRYLRHRKSSNLSTLLD